MRRTSAYCFPRRQKGATLVIALLILVLIMMLGITAVSTSNTQYKLAGNIQFEDAAMNSAETAVATAENWLSGGANNNNTGFATTATPGLLWLGASNTPFTMVWSDTNSISVGGATGPRYTIQLMSINNTQAGEDAAIGKQASSTACASGVNTYLITARGTFARGATKIIQSYYSATNCPAL